MSRHVLTINGGSSSIKFALFETAGALRRIVKGSIERIGLPQSAFQIEELKPADSISRPVAAPTHAAAVAELMNWIEARGERDALSAVAHRVVQGGPRYSAPERITADMIAELRRLSPFDPEHLPEELLLI